MEGERWLRDNIDALRQDFREHRKETTECFRVMTERLSDLKDFQTEVKTDAKWVSIIASSLISLSIAIIAVVLRKYGLEF